MMVFCVGVPGTGAYDNVRPLAYQDAKVFLLCFRVSDPDSLDNAVSKVCDLCVLQWGECSVSCVAKSCVACE
jgi:GTPase SAR1 family protein